MKKRTALLRGAAVFCAVILVAAPAHANAIVPPVFITWLGMSLALVPIIIVETIVFMTAGARFWESLVTMSLGNLASAVAGLPLALVLEFSFAPPPFGELLGEEEPTYRSWIAVHVKPILFVIVCFLVSWGIEAPVAILFLDHLTPQVVNNGVFLANVVTYSAFLLFLLAVFGWESVSYRTRKAAAFLMFLPAEFVRNLVSYRDSEAAARARSDDAIAGRAAAKAGRAAARARRDDARARSDDARAGRAAARARRAVQLKWARWHRDESLKRQDRPVHEADLLEAWRRGNRHAKQGIALLASAEAGIDHLVSADSDNTGVEKVTKKSSRAA